MNSYLNRTEQNFERVLITGASGFTGRYLIDHILSTDNPPAVYGFDVANNVIAGCEMIAGDITLKRDIDRAIQHVKPDCVIHLAVSFDTSDYQKLFLVNVIGTLNLLETLRTNRDPDFPRTLIVGSSAEYGMVLPEELPVSEKNTLRPISQYGTSKVSQSYLGLQYHLSWDMPVIRARTFNLIGPGLSSHFVCGSLVEQFAALEQANKEPVLSLGNLESKRDFVDVRDVVRAYWGIISSGAPGEIYNVCSGEAHSVQNIVDILQEISGLEVEIQQADARKQNADVPVQIGDHSKTTREIGWQPNLGINASLKDMLEWQRGSESKKAGI